jgi:toxin YoeB
LKPLLLKILTNGLSWTKKFTERYSGIHKSEVRLNPYATRVLLPFLYLIAQHTAIVELIKDIDRSPFFGLGKPEPLKHELSGYCSRRINDEHRLVYKVTDIEVIIIACKYHYG